jgi:hypothetical protein
MLTTTSVPRWRESRERRRHRGADARAAARVADGETRTTDLLGEEGVPVALRPVLAAAVLTAADRPVTKRSVTAIAPAARSATYRDHAELLNQVTTCMPALVQAQPELAGAQVSVAELAEQLPGLRASAPPFRAGVKARAGGPPGPGVF